MSKAPTVPRIARELRLSAWMFGIFAVASAVIVVMDMLTTGRIEGGWPVAAAVALIAWIGVIHFAHQLEKTQQKAPRGDASAL
jgi:hypothetical protein